MNDKQVEKTLDEANKAGVNTGNPAALTAFLSGNVDDAITASIPGGIEASEALGQQEVVHSQRLPKDRLMEHREALGKLGFSFGNDIDDVFIEVKLPEGWQKKATDHSMWSDLLDEKGRKRAGIFYKAAFYDRSGHMQWRPRFRVDTTLVDGRNRYDLTEDEVADCVAVVLDADGTELYRTEPKQVGKNDYDITQELSSTAHEWLKERYPQCEEPFAHWDD